jgi:uncharacterized membrane protein
MRDEFISKLKDGLRMLPKEDIDNAVSYYEEYFDEAGEENIQAVLDELGSPSAVASKIIGEYSLKEMKSENSENKKSNKSDVKLLWIVLLSIFAAPIAFPIAAAAFGLSIALIMIPFSLFIAFLATGVGLTIGGIAVFAASIFALFVHFPTAIFMFGLSMLLTCIGISFTMVGWVVIRSTIRFVIENCAKLLTRRGSK